MGLVGSPFPRWSPPSVGFEAGVDEEAVDRPLPGAFGVAHAAEVLGLAPDRTRRLFGTTPLWREQVRVPVSDPTRTIVDVFDDPALGAGCGAAPMSSTST